MSGVQGMFVCANAACKCDFRARLADRDRGWARYCSKSCAAIVKTRKRGGGVPSVRELKELMVANIDQRKKIPMFWEEDLTQEEWANFHKSVLRGIAKDREHVPA